MIPCGGSSPPDSVVSGSGGLDHAEELDYAEGVCLGDGQTEAYLKDMDMMGLASIWAMARRRSI